MSLLQNKNITNKLRITDRRKWNAIKKTLLLTLPLEYKQLSRIVSFMCILSFLNSNGPAITAASTVILALVTIYLARINSKILEKSDQQKKIDVFFHSYTYKKNLLDQLTKLHDNNFGRELMDSRKSLSPRFTYEKAGNLSDSQLKIYLQTSSTKKF